jgi:hypothetical protein
MSTLPSQVFLVIWNPGTARKNKKIGTVFLAS